MAAEHLRPALPREPVFGEVTEAVRMERITAQHKPAGFVRGNVVGDLFYRCVVRTVPHGGLTRLSAPQYHSKHELPLGQVVSA